MRTKIATADSVVVKDIHRLWRHWRIHYAIETMRSSPRPRWYSPNDGRRRSLGPQQRVLTRPRRSRVVPVRHRPPVAPKRKKKKKTEAAAVWLVLLWDAGVRHGVQITWLHRAGALSTAYHIGLKRARATSGGRGSQSRRRFASSGSRFGAWKGKKKILIKRLKYRNEEDGEGKGSGFVFFFDCVIIQ